ncbi:vacuolar 8-like, partial [Olea europaea subsp. europaea]
MKIHIASSLFRVVSTKNQTNNYIVFGGGISGVHLWGLRSLKHYSLRELIVFTVLMLISMSDYMRKYLFGKEALGPLLRIKEYSLIPMKEKVAMAVEFITTDTNNAWIMVLLNMFPRLKKFELH